MERVEKVARAMCEAAGFDPDSTTDSFISDGGIYRKDDRIRWMHFELKAKQHIAAFDVLHRGSLEHARFR